jgi:two-component sensor histidine kinase
MTLRVLYIDDDEGLRALVRRNLERRGFSVETAGSGEEGLARAKSETFDLISLDHFMPGQDGFATLQALRRELADPPPIVYVTGADDTRVAVAALKEGAADYVVKTANAEFFDLLDRTFRQAMEQVELRRSKEKAEAALRASNQRLEALLREVNHRVANSLMMVASFVRMQASSLADAGARAALEDTQRRIGAIIQVHKRLYTHGDVERVDMRDYLSALAAELESTCSRPGAQRAVRLTVDEVLLDTDRAVSLGVILNELVTNACKYAYPADRDGEVRVRLASAGAGLRLSVEDDGVGMAQSIQGTGLGGRLVTAMAKSLGAALTYEPKASGVRAVLDIPVAAAG